LKLIASIRPEHKAILVKYHQKGRVMNKYNNNNIAFFSQASWGRLEMKPEE